MKYYRLENEEKIKYVALPSEFWLPVAEYVCFHPDYKHEDDLFDLISDREDEPEWFLEELPEVQYNTCVELTQEEYQVHTGFIEQTDYFFRNPGEPYYNGEMPDDWEDEAQRALLPSSYWSDQFGYNGDLYKLIDGQIDSQNMFETMIEYMQGVDPELQSEAYSRWIYAHALVEMGKTELISYRK